MVYWLRPNLRVRIVNSHYQKGYYYNKKVTVTDVVQPGILFATAAFKYLSSHASTGVCICISDSGNLLEGLRQEDLETLVPCENGATIMVVRGSHANCRGKMIERQLDKQRVVVHLSGEADVSTFDLDDVCEYVGEYLYPIYMLALNPAFFF